MSNAKREQALDWLQSKWVIPTRAALAAAYDKGVADTLPKPWWVEETCYGAHSCEGTPTIHCKACVRKSDMTGGGIPGHRWPDY